MNLHQNRKREHKYAAKRTVGYHSKREAHRATLLQSWERVGLITELREQVRIALYAGHTDSDGQEHSVPVLTPTGKQAVYVLDFAYIDREGAQVYEDVKGIDTPLSALKRAIVEAQTGIKIKLT